MISTSTYTSRSNNKIDHIWSLIYLASLAHFSVIRASKVVTTSLKRPITGADLSPCVSHRVVEAFQFWVPLSRLPFVHFQIQLASSNYTQITSISKVKVCWVIPMHYTFPDDVLGLGQDSGYVNWYRQKMMMSVFYIFVSPSFTCSFRSLHLNQGSRFWFGQFFLKKLTLWLDHYGLRSFCCSWRTNDCKFFPGLICYRIRIANKYW